VSEFQDEYQKVQMELKKEEVKGTRPIIERIMKACHLVGERSKVSAVVRREVLIWTDSPEMDITNEVIRVLNELYGKEKKAGAETKEEPKDAPKDAKNAKN